MEAKTEHVRELRIRPGSGWFTFDFGELLEARDVLLLLVRRDFVLKYKQTILGPLWLVIQPLLTTLVFTIIFNRVAQISTDGLPPALFYLAGLTIWSYFAQNLNLTANVFTSFSYLFEKVYFPRLIAPLAVTFSNALGFLIQFCTFLFFIIFYKIQGAGFTPNIPEAILFVPLLLLQVAALSLGFGMIFSALTAKYRDLVHLVAFLLQIWMYASPVIYPASRFGERFRWLILINPVSPILENFRGLMLGISSVTMFETAVSVALTLLSLLIGLVLFRRTERTFVDSV
jgi:homopolymeric O-antigen transport system permease protein